MLRERTPALVVSRGLGPVLAASVWLWTMPSVAQTTGAIPGSVVAPETDPNATKFFQSNGRSTVRPAARTPARPLESARLLDPPPSGAGISGFDSSNTGKNRKGKKPKAKAASPARQLEPLGPVTPSGPIGRRPQDRITDKGNAAYAAGPPGRPPVELGPIYTVPKRRKAHTTDDPYAALGLRSGGLLFYPAIELIAGRNSNPAQSTTPASASLFTAAPELKVQSDWSRHEFKADLRGSFTHYSPDTTPTLSRPYFNGKADGRIDVSHNTRIELGGRTLVSTDNPGSPNLSAGLSKLPVFTTVGGSAGVAHRFNRLELAVKGDAERTMYQDSKLTDGTTASNEGRNYNQYGGTLRASYEYYPGVTPFIEGGGDTRKHDLDSDAFGFRRNSNGITAKLGTTFELSRLLTGEIAIGYTKRNYDDARLESLKGLIGNGSLTWTASALTTVKFIAASVVGESTQSGVSGVLYRDAGVQVDHAFRRWLIGTAKFSFGMDDYVGSPRTDKRYSAGLGLTYKLNRTVQIKGEVRRDWLRSSIDGADYNANIFLIGLRLQY